MIGIVGAGEIVVSAHLPAYRSLGVPVVSIFDVDAQRGLAVAKAAGADAAPSLAALLADPRVEIVDVAVTPRSSAAVVAAALTAGKHVLAQKPLAGTLREARDLVRLAAVAGRLLVVNQQMRYSPVVCAIRDAAGDGRLGRLTHLSFDLDLPLPAGNWDHWLAREERPVIALNTIHLLDTARFLMGEPVGVLATTWRDTTQLQLAGETEASIAVDFAGGARLNVVDRRNGFGELNARFRAEGECGAVRGELGMWINYPACADDVAQFRPAGAGGQWEAIELAGRWLPDAFTGPISDLLAAIRTGRRPGTDGVDNLRTLALVEACYESASAGRYVKLGRMDEVEGDNQ